MHLLVCNDKGKPKLVRAKPNQRPGGVVCHAPAGFKEGDEKFLSFAEDGSLIIDKKSHGKRIVKENTHKKKVLRKEVWNTRGIMQRLKAGYLK